MLAGNLSSQTLSGIFMVLPLLYGGTLRVVGARMFGGLEYRIAQAVFAIPGIKGIEFGSGFSGAAVCGSENNDAFYMEGDKVATHTDTLHHHDARQCKSGKEHQYSSVHSGQT